MTDNFSSRPGMMMRNTREALLPKKWEVPQKFRDRLGDSVGRQRAMVHEGHLLLVLHRVPDPEEKHRDGRFFWKDHEGKWRSREMGEGPKSLGLHMDEYVDRLAELEAREEVAESSEDYFQILSELSPILRAARNMHQTLQQARQMCEDDREIILFRDRSYVIERTAELLYNDTKNSLDFTIAHQAEQQAVHAQQMAVSAHRLNILAAFFFPIMTLTAIFGMNLEFGYETHKPPYPFLTVLGGGLLLGFIIKLIVIRRT